MNNQFTVMDTQSLKLGIINKVLQIADIAILEDINNTLESYTVKKKNVEVKPMSIDKFYAMIDQAEEDAAHGHLIAHEDVVSYFNKKKHRD